MCYLGSAPLSLDEIVFKEWIECMQHGVQLSSHKLDLVRICILTTKTDVTKIHLYAIPGY